MSREYGIDMVPIIFSNNSIDNAFNYLMPPNLLQTIYVLGAYDINIYEYERRIFIMFGD